MMITWYSSGTDQHMVADFRRAASAFSDGHLMKNRAISADFGIMGYHNAIETMGKIRCRGKSRAKIPMSSHGRVMKSVCPLDIVQPEQISQPAAPFGVHHKLTAAPIFFMIISLDQFSEKPLHNR